MMPLIRDRGHAMIWLAVDGTSQIVAAKSQKFAIDMFIKKFGTPPTHLLWVPYFLSEETTNDRAIIPTGPKSSNPKTNS